MKPIHGLYAVAVAAVTVVEHETVGRRLRRHEIPRIALGVITVLGLARLAASVDADADPWALILGGFIVGGAARTACEVMDAKTRRERLDNVRREIQQAAL